MSFAAMKGFSDEAAATRAKALEFGEAARALARPEDKPRAWLAKLDAAGLHEDATRLLAAGLGKPDCVRWALGAARELAAKKATAEERAALEAAARWVEDPSDGNRRAAGAAAEAAKLTTSAGCTALAAFLSGGSLAPVGLVAVPPADHLTALTAAAAIQLAAQLDGPLAGPAHLKRFFAQGTKLAAGEAAAPGPAAGPAPGARPAAPPKKR